MANSCAGQIKNSPLIQSLKEIAGMNNSLFNEYYNTAIVNGKYTDEYKAWAKEHLQKDLDDAEVTADGEKDLISAYSASQIVDYYNQVKPAAISDTAINKNTTSNKIHRFGYSSVEARTKAIQQCARMCLAAYRKQEHETKVGFDNWCKEKFPDIAKSVILKNLITASIKRELNARLRAIGMAEINFKTKPSMMEIEKAVSKINNKQSNNLLALYKEILSNNTDLFRLVFNNSNLSSLRINNDEENNDSYYDAIESQVLEDPNDTENEDTTETSNSHVDKSLEDLNSHDGQYSTFTKHITEDVKLYFNSLVKLNSEIETDIALDDELGLPETMNADECASVLYSYMDKTNKDRMIESIRIIANVLPGFKSFNKFANDLANDTNFANKIYTIFAKTIFSKYETRKDGDFASSRISNRSADKLTALRFEYLNGLKTTALYLENDIDGSEFSANISRKVAELKKIENNINNAETKEDVEKQLARKYKLIKELYNNLYEQIHKFVPTIEQYTITNFLDNANDKNVINNINQLATKIADIIKSNKITQNNFLSIKAKAAEINSYNYKQKKIAQEDPGFKPEYKTTIDIYASEYTSNQTQSAAFTLADMLVHYTVVKTELNSRNVHGNQSSDVINNNMITNLLNTLKTKVGLQNYGNYKLQGTQYDFSNILIEHRDDKNNIVNYGLFRKDPNTGDVVTTEYAYRLLQASLFSGATNVTSNESATYPEMSGTDYKVTSFINYFTLEPVQFTQDPNDKYTIPYANYFLRTPSDAPKNYILTAPRYKTKDKNNDKNSLFRIADEKGLDSKIDKIYKELPKFDENDDDIIDIYDFAATLNTTKLDTIRKEDFIKLLLKENIDYIKLGKQKGNNTIKPDTKIDSEVRAVYNITVNGEDVHFIVKGTLGKNDNNVRILQNPTIESIDYEALATSNIKAGIKADIKQYLLDNNRVDMELNREHPIFKQFCNIFKQELTDCASALNTIFKNTNGVINRVQDGKNIGDLIFNPGFDNSKETGRKMYAIYHIGKGSKTILDMTKEGNARLTGQVFTSDRFKTKRVMEDGTINITNYGKDFINANFDLLYGRPEDGNLLKTKLNPNGNISIDLDDTQNAKLEDMIESFIKDYLSTKRESFARFSDLIPKNLINDDNIIDYYMNEFVALNMQNDLFTGDSKFYKDTQTEVKREKETQGSGVPYGITNYEANFFDNEILPSEINDVSFQITPIENSMDSRDHALNKHIYDRVYKEEYDRLSKQSDDLPAVHFAAEEVASKAANSIKQTSKFTGVTIKNTIKTGATIGKVVKENGKYRFVEKGVLAVALIDSLKKKGLESDEAEEKAAIMMKGYMGTTVNDAQSYITFEEWVRRITARGQYPKYKKLIEAILDETKPVDASVIGEFIQVQKNFYYDHYYNAKLGVTVPRQIKNAEFVLVPRFIRGTELEKVYDLMQKYDINQLNTEETSKAGKANVLSLWDENGVLTDENIEDFENNVVEAKELYNYNYLYTQQETPQHMDAENKAGIQIMKKILDNIDKNSPLYEYKELFFKLYSTKIQNSFTSLMKELDVELDENGNIQLDEDGKIKGLNTKKLLAKFEAEAARLNLDSNMMDYYTVDENALNEWAILNTVMPFYMSNVSTKVENIAQAIFNNNITRQKLPGFHAAQITNVGWNKLSDAVDNVQYSKTLQYHPEGKPYIEIMVPRSVFDFKRDVEYIDTDGTTKTRRKSDDELLAELKSSKLDEIIGYRIPTEGKQSVCIMKIVGFVDDALGSTIIVPDDWVSQTGSDFDIDSVYTITYSTYKDKLGKLRKAQYKSSENLNIYDWYRYIEREGKKLEKDLHHDGVKENYEDILETAKDKTKEEISELFETHNDNFRHLGIEESVAYKNLPDDLKDYIKTVNEKVNELFEGNEVSKKDKYATRLSNVIDAVNKWLTDNIDNLEENEVEKVNKFIEINNKLFAFINDTESTKYDYNEIKSSKVTSGIEATRRQQLLAYEKDAKDNNLLSYEDFIKKANEDINFINSEDAINNGILDCMLEILKAPESLEENLSRSNFDDIIDARDEAMDPNVKLLRNARSPYDIDDQADYMEDVMSGAGLKAFSVVRDTLCSICNTVKPKINDAFAITVAYDATKYDIKDLVAAFGNVDDKSVPGKYIVKHNMFGWSLNNKNAVGKILTSYSSQTTAHILDAVKEGPIPNVNEFTFQVYKTFSDIGSDFGTGIPFIMQPGITEIVKAYQKSNSIYAYSSGDPVKAAFKAVAIRIDPTIKKETKFDEIITKMQTYAPMLASIFGIKSDKFAINLELDQAAKLNIDGVELTNRLKGLGRFSGTDENTELIKNLFDLGVIMQFNKLNTFGNKISSYARVCNPDKFGAKQSIFATNQVFDNITDIISEETPVLTVNKEVTDPDTQKQVNADIHFVQSIYPGFNGNLDDYIKSTRNDSTYPPLHNFLKYATATSIKVNRMLFETQNPKFVEALLDLRNVFSNRNGKLANLDEKTYKNYQNYVISYFYNQVPTIAKRVVITDNGSIDCDITVSEEDERKRIYGYNRTPDFKVKRESIIDDPNNPGNKIVGYDEVDFSIEDIKHPTKDEIKEFLQLSPAQKVLFMQQNLGDCGVLKNIKVTLFNPTAVRKDKTGSQSIEYIENNIDIETIYNQFDELFYNSNPLCKLTAIDIIKYGFIVEGYRMKKNAVNKVIKNACIYQSVEEGGLGVIDHLNNNISQIANNTLNMDIMRENFIRSHSTISQIALKNVEKVNKSFETNRYTYGELLIVPKTDKDFIEKYGIGYVKKTKKDETIEPNTYVRLRQANKVTLYKIKDVNNDYVLYPLNVLQENENSEFSSNQANNLYPKASYYENVISTYYAEQENIQRTLVDIYKNTAKERLEARAKREYIKTTYAKDFDINDDMFTQSRNKIRDYFNSPNHTNHMYLTSLSFEKYIHYTGDENGVIKEIDGKKYLIVKANFYKYNKMFFNNKTISDKKLLSIDPQVRAIMENAANSGYRVNNAFYVTPYNEAIANNAATATESTNEDVTEEMHSSITEFATEAIDAMYNASRSNNDELAGATYRDLRAKNIEAKAPSVEANMYEVIQATHEYLQSKYDDIMKNINHFTLNDDDTYVNIIAPESIAEIKGSAQSRKRFLKTILDAKAIVTNYNMINDFDITSADKGLEKHLSEIRNIIQNLANNTLINRAEELFAKEYLAKLSNNPNIVNDMESILDGYHSVTAMEAWINDIQETPNPLIQIISKEVMEDIRTKELLAKEHVAEFRKNLHAVIDEAAKHGYSINWKNIIDDMGRFTQDYNDMYLKDLQAHRDNISAAIAEYGEFSKEHMLAKFEYDKWKLNHVNREIVDDFYQKRLDLDKNMLDNWSTIYCEYYKLQAKRQEISKHKDANGKIEDAWADALADINNDIKNLLNDFYYDKDLDDWFKKTDVEDPTNHFKDKRNKILYSEASARELSKYINDIKKLNEQYFTRDSRLGFEEELEKNIKIIESYELKVNGHLIRPMSELLKIEEYKNAKDWIANNTIWTADKDILDELNKAYAILKEGKKGKEYRKQLHNAIKNHDAYDNYGFIKANEFTDEEIARIKDEEQRRFTFRETAQFSDTHVLSNAAPNGIIFKPSFYNAMKGTGAKNQDYLKKVAEINELLQTHYDPSTKLVHTSELSILELNKMERLFSELENIRSTNDVNARKKLAKHIKENVQFVTNMSAYVAEEALAKQKGMQYLAVWRRCNNVVQEWNDVYNIAINPWLYAYAAPKDFNPSNPEACSLLDKERMKALETVNKYTKKINSPYYNEKFNEMKEKERIWLEKKRNNDPTAEKESPFQTWFNANHIFNTYTRAYEPLSCWTKNDIGNLAPDGSLISAGKYEPNYLQSRLKIRNGKNSKGEPDFNEPDYTNHNYNSIGANYSYNFKPDGVNLTQEDLESDYDFEKRVKKYKDNVDYSSNLNINDYERKVKDYLQSIMQSRANVSSAKDFMALGYAPIKHKSETTHDAKFFANELLKFIGFYSATDGREDFMQDNEVNYAYDNTPIMPMMSTLAPYRSKIKKEDFTKDGEFNEKEYKAAVKKEKDEYHKANLNTNWEDVFAEFIENAEKFNAIQDNKYMLFYGQTMLDKIKVYVQNLGFNNLKKSGKRHAEEGNRYATQTDENLKQQYTNWVRRLVYNQWKEPNNKLTRAANIAQMFTSAKFMMLNITGGIANVTAGKTQIFAELLANEHFGAKEWTKASLFYYSGLMSYFTDMYSDKATSLPSAIIKLMQVVDFDEVTGSVKVDDLSEHSKRFRDFMFSTQQMGEHSMQNTAMFAIFEANRIVRNPKSMNEHDRYTIMSFGEYMLDASTNALMTILDDKEAEKFNEFKKYELSDPNRAKDYFQFRKDIATEFCNIYLSDDKKRQFRKSFKEIEANAKKEFNDDSKNPTVLSQFELVDGYAKFKKDSLLSTLGEDAFRILGKSKNRTISTNKKIHGIYDRLGAAQIEKHWWGALTTQYHKHLYPGIMKRYRRKGMFNEERGTIEKGNRFSIIDFLALPLHKKSFMKKLKYDNNMTDSQLQLIEGTQNLMKDYINFFLHIKLNWGILPEYDRANILRSLGDVCGSLSALLMSVALHCVASDDDKSGLLFNLALYECDRLASESMQFSLFGVYAEGKKLWSSPVAVQGTISDCFNAMSLIAQYIIQGDDFDPTYKSGLYAGENKFEVLLKRNIPLYHSLNMLERLEKSNKYYKLSQNILGIIPAADIADWIMK